MKTQILNKTIDLLCKNNADIRIDGKGNLLVHLSDQSTPNISPEAVELVIKFLEENEALIAKKDAQLLSGLKTRLQKAAKGNDQLLEKIEAVCQHIFNPLDKTPKAPCQQPIHVVSEVSHAPSSAKELLHNLNLVAQNPKYTLLDTLAVIDCKYLDPPPHWSKMAVFQELHRRLNAEQSLPIDQHNPVLIEALKDALSLYKPLKVVPFCIIVQKAPGADNGALLTDFLIRTNNGIPTLTTREIIKDLLSVQDIERLKFEMYTQKDGSLVLALPSYLSPSEVGINRYFKSVQIYS